MLLAILLALFIAALGPVFGIGPVGVAVMTIVYFGVAAVAPARAGKHAGPFGTFDRETRPVGFWLSITASGLAVLAAAFLIMNGVLELIYRNVAL